MATEIERKFKVSDITIDTLAGERLTQGYLSHDKNATVRIAHHRRHRLADHQG